MVTHLHHFMRSYLCGTLLLRTSVDGSYNVMSTFMLKFGSERVYWEW